MVPRGPDPPLSTSLVRTLRRHAETRSAGDLAPLVDGLGRELLPFLERHLRRSLARRVDPLDVFQDVCLRLADAGERLYDAGPRAAWALIYRVARNELARTVERHQASRRDVRLEESAAATPGETVSGAGPADRTPATTTSPSAAALRGERATVVASCVERLSPADRELIRLLHFEQLGNAEAARRLRTTVDVVRVRHFRALRRLRELVSRRLGDVGMP